MKNPFKRSAEPQPSLDLSGYDDNIDYSDPEPQPEALKRPAIELDYEIVITVRGSNVVPDERAARILQNRINEWMETLDNVATLFVKDAVTQAKQAYENGEQR